MTSLARLLAFQVCDYLTLSVMVCASVEFLHSDFTSVGPGIFLKFATQNCEICFSERAFSPWQVTSNGQQSVFDILHSFEQ